MNDTSNTQTPDACATDESLIQSNWKWLAFRGALALLFGVIALFSPLSACMSSVPLAPGLMFQEEG
jgi:uncharacterized membrane protein HdeD (DUF308 family)